MRDEEEILVDRVDTIPFRPLWTLVQSRSAAPLKELQRRLMANQVLDLPPGRIERLPAAKAVPDWPRSDLIVSWRHGYRTGISQSLDLLQRLERRTGAPHVALQDAIRTLQGWLADPH